MEITTGTIGTVQQIVNTREGAVTYTRRVEVIEWQGEGEMADGLVRVKYLIDPADPTYMGSHGFEWATDITVEK